MRIISFFTVLSMMTAVFMMLSSSVFARSEAIAIVVNDGVITRSDIEDRMKLIMVSSGLPNNEKTQAQLLPQIVSSLIDEKIRMQEADKLELKVSPPEIAKGFAAIAQQNNMPPEQFEAVLERSGLNKSTLKKQIEAQIAWTKVVQAKLHSRINISDNDVEARLQRIVAAKGKNEYLLAEIFLPIEREQDKLQVRQLAQRLSADMKAGKVPFSRVAQQFSKAAGASQGGDLGWVQEGQLPQELDQGLVGLEKGQISAPIQSLSGYHLLLVRDKRQISDETLPQRDQIRQQIGMERLERLQRRYLMDLKSAAFIENRLVPQS